METENKKAQKSSSSKKYKSSDSDSDTGIDKRLTIGAGGLLKKVGATKLVSDASSIVIKAASILEENIAEGIVAAKAVEGKYVNIKKMRSHEHNDLMNRYRKDTHEALDIIFDALTYVTSTVESLVDKSDEMDKKQKSSTSDLPVLEAESSLAPGEQARIALMLENESSSEEMRLEFTDLGLTSDQGAEIKTRNITFDPKILLLPPGGSGKIDICVYVPKTTKAGRYTGRIHEKTMTNLQAVVAVDVKE